MSYDPRPRSAERLQMEPHITAEYDNEGGVVRIRAEFTYQPWCCNGTHEVIDGLQTLHDVIDKAAHRAYKRRTRKIQEEIGEVS